MSEAGDAAQAEHLFSLQAQEKRKECLITDKKLVRAGARGSVTSPGAGYKRALTFTVLCKVQLDQGLPIKFLEDRQLTIMSKGRNKIKAAKLGATKTEEKDLPNSLKLTLAEISLGVSKTQPGLLKAVDASLCSCTDAIYKPRLYADPQICKPPNPTNIRGNHCTKW